MGNQEIDQQANVPSNEQLAPQTIPTVVGPRPKRIFLVFSIIFVLLVAGVIGYFVWTSVKKKEEMRQPATSLSSGFATYKEFSVDFNPQVNPYQVDDNLGDIINKESFSFSPEAKNLLVKNAFVVKSAYNQEFFSIYEENRYRYTPNFVTTDSMLHNYHLMFDHALKKLEEEKLIFELKSLNSAMLSASLEQYSALKGTEWENAAKRNVGFFSVGSKLLDQDLKIASVAKDEVEQELALIEAHQEIKSSPVMNIGAGADIIIETPQGPQPLEALKEDYSQYVPRGHYDKTEALKAYFKSMMWYGRLTFRFKNEDEVKSALLITLALNKGNNREIWNKIYEPINFFVGKSDDITYYQFKDLLEQTYGQNPALETLAKDKSEFSSFVEAARKLEPPQINSMPIFQASIQPDREKEIKGFRFMGQRFTIDASIFQRLLYREVGDKTKSCQEYQPEKTGCLSGARCLPKGLDIPAAMGSAEALNIVKEMGETQYACYQENLSKMEDYISGLKTEIWTQNLYWGWLYSLLPLTTEKPEGFPSFMRNLAWTRKELNTYLGSWTELKHDTILYAKQVYAELGGGGEIEEKDDRGYVEPNPYLYARLASLLKMTMEGLEARGLLSSQNKENLEKMQELALSLKTISEKELNNQSLTDEEYELIRSYGGQLEHFWLEVNQEEMQAQGLDKRNYLDQNPAAIVADVATDPNGQVLEEATGYISEIYVVVPVEGKLKIAKGGVYSYYEFPWPISDRLTDKKWREILVSGQAPALPEWTAAFVSK
ncbi:MAG TPA: DUF3160 domain-containing protein [Clostridia bacterium]|nr:DUF3160 domain-containing protein [Clostridia bacterium]